MRKSMRVFSLNDPGNINIDKTVTMGYSATKGRDSYYDYYEDAISANDGLTINAWSLDPSVATVTVSESVGKPVIRVKGIKEGYTTIMAMAKYGDDVMYAKRRVTVVIPTFTLAVSSHDQPVATGYSRTLTADCRVDDVPVTADHYEWEITESIGAADATLTPNGSTAILKAGRQGGCPFRRNGGFYGQEPPVPDGDITDPFPGICGIDQISVLNQQHISSSLYLLV